MKKLLLLIASTGFLFSSCQKDESSNPAADVPSPTNRNSNTGITAVSPLPTKFLKKILVEEYVGTTNGFVPEANNNLQRIVQSYRDRVYSLGMHYNDPLTTLQTSKILNQLGNPNPTIPTGTIDRKAYNGLTFMDSKSFPNNVTLSLSSTPNCGLAITSSVSNRIADIYIHCGFLATLPGNYNVTAYIVEDRVTNTNLNLQQANAFNNNSSSAFYHLGNPIVNYTHYNVISKLLTNSLGDGINPAANVPGGKYIHHLRTDMPRKLDANSTLMIITFLTNTSTNEVVNVQKAPLGSVKDWN